MEGYNFPDAKRPRLDGFSAGEYYKYPASAGVSTTDYSSTLRPASAQSQPAALPANLFGSMHQPQTGMTASAYGSSQMSSGLSGHYDTAASQYSAYRHTPPLLHHRNQFKPESASALDQKPFSAFGTGMDSLGSAAASAYGMTAGSPYSTATSGSTFTQSQYGSDGFYRTYGGSNISDHNSYNEQKPQSNWLCSAGNMGSSSSMSSMSPYAHHQNMGAGSLERSYPSGYKFNPYSALDHMQPSNPHTPAANVYSMFPKMEGMGSSVGMAGSSTMFNSSHFNPYGNPMSPNSSCQYGAPYGTMQAQGYGPPPPPAVPLMNPRWQYDFRGYSEEFLDIEVRLSQMLSQLRFGGQVTYIYNPVQYAYEPHSQYVKRFCTSRKRILFLGMNPGPYGMAQTGVPFGEVKVVKEWLKVSGEIHRPPVEHPKKPIWGFDCPKSNVSGQRFWGLIQRYCKKPEFFFKHCFVHHMCPLIFINHTGKSFTPAELPAAERRMLLDICERSICEVVQLLGVEIVIGVGKFPQERARAALKAVGMDWVRVETIMHPSPANPMANKNWDGIAEKQLEDMGVLEILKSSVGPMSPEPSPAPSGDSRDATAGSKDSAEGGKQNGEPGSSNGTPNDLPPPQTRVAESRHDVTRKLGNHVTHEHNGP